MTELTLLFDPYAGSAGMGVVCYHLSSGERKASIKTSYSIYPYEWDCDECDVIVGSASVRTDSLIRIKNRIRADKSRLRRIIDSIVSAYGYADPLEVADEFIRQDRDNSLQFFSSKIIAQLEAAGRMRTSETYRATVKSFMRFTSGADVRFDEFSADMMGRYEKYLLKNGLTLNTVSFYMRVLRAIYNRAVDNLAIDAGRPFRNVYTGIDRTVKRALPASAIKRIRDLDLSSCPSLALARDIFMFSFYTRGMSFVDMAFLRKSDLKSRTITYRRRKTNQTLHIWWEPEMQQLVDRYSDNHGIYLLPILRGNTNEWEEYKTRLGEINRALKKVGHMAGLRIPLTTYVARHSWASIARCKSIPLSVISESMGHESDTTTQIYLASLNVSVIHRANRRILRGL